MYLRSHQTRAVQEILRDLRADPKRHLPVLHHPGRHLRRLVGSHDQPLGRAPPDLGRGAPSSASRLHLLRVRKSGQRHVRSRVVGMTSSVEMRSFRCE